MKQQTVTINGAHYDAHTGMPIKPTHGETRHKAKLVQSAASHHKRTERSKTLRRRSIESPVKSSTKTSPAQSAKAVRSPMIRKFSHDITPTKVTNQPKSSLPASADVAPSIHPIQRKAAISPKKPTPVHHQKPAHEIKQNEVEKALDKAKPSKEPKISFLKRHPKFLSVTTLSALLILAGGYLTYTNLPNLSVQVAAAQAGITASLPSYQPSGYSLSPVQYTDGEVNMKFNANAGPQSFTIKQQKSSWDSSALLENFVKEKATNGYNTYNDSGLTLFIYGTNATWVNGGVLHLIEGDAPLTNEQIRRIATSM